MMVKSETENDTNGSSPRGEDEKVRVGKFSYRGEIKHFALVPRGKIDSESDLQDLLDLWELSSPNYLLETNQSEKRRDMIITKENAAGILKQIFKPDIDIPENRKKYPLPQALHVPLSRHSAPNPGQTQKQTLLMKPSPIKLPSKSAPTEIFQQKQQSQPTQNQPADPVTETTDETTDHGDLDWLKQYTGQPDDEMPDWSWINKYLHRKTIEVLKSIVSAAELVNGWLLCHGPPSSNEKMLEVALDLTGSAPTILVVDDIGWYINCWEAAVLDASEAPALQRERTEEFRDHVKNVVDTIMREKSTMELNTALQNPEEYDMFPKCEEISHFEDNFDLSYRRSSTLDPEKNAKEPALWGYRPGASETGGDYHTLGLSSKDKVEGKDAMEGILVGQWTSKFPWTRGTHFIFSDGFEDFKPCMLGARSGFVCMHGGTGLRRSRPKGTGYIIRESINQLKPCILLDNTGAETQMYAKLIKAIQKKDRRNSKTASKEKPSHWAIRPRRRDKDDELGVSVEEYYSKLQVELRGKVADLLQVANKGQSTEDGKGLSVLNTGDVLDTIDRYCSNPRLFQKIVVPVDPLHDSPEDILRLLSEGFQRAALEAREVGAGSADEEAVKAAWRLHEQLSKTVCIKRRLSLFFYSVFLFASFLTTGLSVLERFEKWGDDLQWPATTVAMIAAFCVGAINLFDSDAKINSIEKAQAQIVYEIFRFRMRVGKYSLNTREIAEDLEGAAELPGEIGDRSARRTKKKKGRSELDTGRNQSSNESKKMHASRSRFSNSIKGIINSLGSIDLHFQENYSPKRNEYYIKNSQPRAGKEKNEHEFKSYVVDQLHLTDASESCQDIALCGLIAPEDYFQIRLIPLLDWLEKKEDSLRFKMRSLQILNMICNGAAVVLGAANCIMVIPIVVAFAALLFQLLKIFDYERRFVITSSAARELRVLLGTWQALGALDHHTHSAVRRLVNTCEQVAIQFGTNSTIQVDKSAIGMDTATATTAGPHKHQPGGDLNV